MTDFQNSSGATVDDAAPGAPDTSHSAQQRAICGCFPHGPDDPCTCAGCWACDGSVVGCTCDIAWDCEHRS